VNELLSRKTNLEATRAELTTKLAATRSSLDNLTDPRNTDELLDHEGKAAALVAAIVRVDSALEAVDRELQAENATATATAQLDLIEDAATAALAATNREQNEYDDIARELEALFARIITAHQTGQDARRQLRRLLEAAVPALALLGSPTTYSAAREAEAKELEAVMNDRGVDLRLALEPDARLRYGSALLPLIDEWQHEQRLEVA
jgi:chromosome segregation ATPase